MLYFYSNLYSLSLVSPWLVIIPLLMALVVVTNNRVPRRIILQTQNVGIQLWLSCVQNEEEGFTFGGRLELRNENPCTRSRPQQDKITTVPTSDKLRWEFIRFSFQQVHELRLSHAWRSTKQSALILATCSFVVLKNRHLSARLDRKWGRSTVARSVDFTQPLTPGSAEWRSMSPCVQER